MTNFQNEWSTLHGNIEKYERFSLLIKLLAVLMSMLAFVYSYAAWVAVMLVFILWLQDGIWKTFQKRLETRICFVEQKIAEKNEDQESAFQYYSQWESQRSGMLGLVKEYLLNALKPTVAYPYAILVVFIPLVHYFAN